MNTTPLRVASATEHNGISLRLIGYWSDLMAYYEGSDGNVWLFSTGASYGRAWSNQGNAEAFKRALAQGKYRGQLI